MAGHRLECTSCGSHDVTVDPPYYRCNHCKSRYLLPEAYYQKSTETGSKKWRVLLGVLALTVATTLVTYFLIDQPKVPTIEAKAPSANIPVPPPAPTSAPTPPPKSPSKTPPKSSHKPSFHNIVFDSQFFGSLRELVRAGKNTYLVAGNDSFNHIRLVELSATGKVLSNHLYGKGFYVSLFGREDKSVVLSYHNMHQKGETLYLDSDKKIRHKIPQGFDAVVPHQGGFIGVKNAKIARYDRDAKLQWSHILNPKKVIKKAGMRRNAQGTMVPFSRTFDFLQLKHLIKLPDENFVAIGKELDGRVAMIKFDKNGKTQWYKRIDLGRIYIDGVTVTSEGGWVLLGRRWLRLFTFDAEGTLIKKQRLISDNEKYYGNAIITTPDGYIVTGIRSRKDASMILIHVDKKSDKITRHYYDKPGMRLHPVAIIPAYDQGYLVAVDTEIRESWIVKVDSDGQLNANLNDPTLDRNTPASGQSKPLPMTTPGNVLPSSTTLPVTQSDAPLTIVPTKRLLGDRFYDMTVSADGNHLYAATGSTGFKIFRRDSHGAYTQIANLLRTRSKLTVTPHRISIPNYRIPHDSPYYYDAAWQVRINSDETRAFISDVNHGFYIVDIRDKHKPKLLATLPGVKARTFAISPDGRTLYLYDTTLHTLDIDSLIASPTLRETIRVTAGHSPTTINRMQLVHRGRYLAVTAGDQLIVYDTHLAQETDRYAIDRYKTLGDLRVDQQNNLYLLVPREAFHILHLDPNGKLTFRHTLMVPKYARTLLPLPTINRLCYGGDQGTRCLDTTHPNNSTSTIRFRNDADNGVTALAMDRAHHEMVMAFGQSALGAVKIKKVP